MNNTQESLLKKNSITISSLCYEDEVELNFGCEYELIERDGKHILIKKKPKYPKTYKECCAVLGMTYDYPDIKMVSIDECSLYTGFIELIRCRNAYWKIAGEEMGLDKPWKPDFVNCCDKWYYRITTRHGAIVRTTEYMHDSVLIFPTNEIAKEFYNNFKSLIENCKELL